MASNIINGGAKPNPISIGPAPIATFTDGADGAPIPSLKFYIEPKQDLHGYSNPWTGGGGSNIWDEEWERGRLVFDKNDANWGQNAASDTAIRSKNYVPITPDASYYGKFASGATAYAIFYDSNKSPVLYGTSGYKSIANQSFTAPATAYYMRFYVQSTTEYANNIAINYPSTVTTYSPYSNICPITGWTAIDGRKSGADTSDYTSIPLTIPGTPGTVYGGYWDVVNGKLYARPYIASYSGQALVGPWVSSHDKYVSGGTPTTGAQVVDMGGTLTEYSVTPITNLSTLLGVNNIWCDSGDTTLTYYQAAASVVAVYNRSSHAYVAIPLDTIRYDTYQITPQQAIDLDSYRSESGTLIRNVVGSKCKLEYNTPMMDNNKWDAVWDVISAGFNNNNERKLKLKYFDTLSGTYKTGWFYVPDVQTPIRSIDEANGIINYNEIRLAFIEY